MDTFIAIGQGNHKILYPYVLVFSNFVWRTFLMETCANEF